MPSRIKNNPAIPAGLFFTGIICLSSYLSQLSNIIFLFSFLVCCFSIISVYYLIGYQKYKLIITLVCILGLIIGIHTLFSLIAVSTLFYFYISTKSKWETILWKTSCSFVVLTITVNIFAYWGLPGTIIHIWFWSIPFMGSLIILFYFCNNKYVLFSIVILCASSIFLNEILLYINDTECLGVISEHGPVSSESMPSLLSNITNRSSLITAKDAVSQISNNHRKRKWIISLVATPALNPEWFNAHALRGEYYIFAEHDNLTSFIGPNSPFNSDSYRRKGPWALYKPVMNYRLFNASRKDVLYCSNIGCTLKRDFVSYPLVWDYTQFGIPILLAKGFFDGSRRFVYVGDSDPSGAFLAPYNPLWLRSLLGIPDYFRIIEAVLILIFGFCILGSGSQKINLVVLLLLVLSFSALNDQYINITPTVDVSINSTGPWLSPHYASHYSSLPKNLSQQNLTVSVQRKKSIATVDIEIIGKQKYRLTDDVLNRKWNIKLCILLPGSSIITANGDIISAGDLPLGRNEIILEKYKKKLIVEDARNLSINGRSAGIKILLSENVYALGTNSPQRLEGINDIITKQ